MPKTEVDVIDLTFLPGGFPVKSSWRAGKATNLGTDLEECHLKHPDLHDLLRFDDVDLNSGVCWSRKKTQICC